MKKHAKIIVTFVLFILLVGMTPAFGEEETDIWWGDNRSNATELFPGVLYRVHGVSSLFSGGWYYIRPTADDVPCFIYNRIVTEGRYNVQVYDAVGNKIDTSIGFGVNDEGRFDFNVQANDIIYLRFISDSLVASQPLITICFPDTHDLSGSSERILTEPTCTQVGYKGISCRLCHVNSITEELPKVAHTPSEWTVVTEATCTTSGLTEQHCEICGELLSSREIPATGHTNGFWVTAHAASCTSAGLQQLICESCGAVLQEEKDPPLGHDYTDWEVVVEASKQEEGVKFRYCLYCGDEQYESIPKKPKFLGLF